MKLIRKHVMGFEDEEDKIKHESVINKDINKYTSEFKVICAGHGRTGTKSLRAALNILGFPCYDGTEAGAYKEESIWDDLMRQKLKTKFVQSPKAPLIDYNEWDKIFINRGFVSCTDGPMNFFWEELAEFYPKSKILLTVRDPQKWYDSMETVHPLCMTFRRRWLMRLLFPYPQFIMNIWNFHVPMRSITDIDNDNGMRRFKEEKDIVLDQFGKWNQDVIDYCMKHGRQLLVYQLKSGWEPLCEFLEVDVPMVDFPRTNSRQDMLNMIGRINLVCDAVNFLIFAGVAGSVYVGYYKYNKRH